MKNIVFCDTMIWYKVHQNEIKLDKTKYKYFGSASNLMDFYASDKKEKTEDKIKLLKNAIKCMDQFADDVIMVDPISAGASNLFNMEINKFEIIYIKESYQQLLRYAYDNVSIIYEPTIDSLRERKKIFQEGAFNFKKDINILFKDKNYTDEEKKKLRIKNTERWLFNEWNRIYYNNQFEGDINLLNWDSIEVFVKSYSEFIKNIKTELPNKNTMLDLIQLLYIRPNGPALFWTEEPKLLKKIRACFSESECRNIIYQDHLGYCSTTF